MFCKLNKEFVMINMSREEVVTHLQNGVKSFKFLKADGTERSMKATLNFDLIPEDSQPKSGKATQSESVSTLVKAFDVEMGAWRSFKVDKLVSFEV
jgi:hypothetical protein